MKALVIGSLTVLCISSLLLGMQSMRSTVHHTPKFTYGQCFNKMGLREPWDLEVAGRVYSRGYNKYLVMYADEANRETLAPKTSWEEDIQSFDAKYQVTPCPETWRKHTHGKSKAEK